MDSEWRLDGRSLLPLLKNPEGVREDRTLYWRRSGIEGPIALREGNWKLLSRNSDDKKPELYNLAKDVGEKNNIAEQNPKVLKRLMKKLDAWESELVTPLWGPGSLGFAEPKQK